MNQSLEGMLNHLPKGESFERNITLPEAETLGVGFCGDMQNGCEVYKFLSSEGVMFTYLRRGDILEFWQKQKLHS